MKANIKKGAIAKLTAVQPCSVVLAEQFIKAPEAIDASVTDPKTNKSLIPCTLPLSGAE